MSTTAGRDLASAPPAVRGATLVGVFLLAAASVALEVLLTRIFSVMMWYHYAFLVVSIAMLGSGAGAALLAAAQGAGSSSHPASAVARTLRRLDRANTPSLLWKSALCFAASVPISLLALVHLPFTAGLGWAAGSLERALSVGFYLAAALPFGFLGIALTTALTRSGSLVGAVYGADLAGAGLGGVLGVVLLRPLGGPGAVGAIGVMGGIAAVVLAWPAADRRARRWTVIALPLLVLAAGGLRLVTVPLRAGKAQEMYPRPGAPSRLLLSLWNPLSRLDVISPTGTPIEPTQRDLPPSLWVFIDGKALTEIPHAGPGVDLKWLAAREPSLPYAVTWPGSALIIGAGGGIDVCAALAAGARRVTAVEINPLIVDLVRRRYAWYAGDLYAQPRVRVEVGEGRHFASCTKQRYDLVQLSLVDTWAAASSGAYSLSENYLYTVEAFQAYLDRLRPGGVLAVTRWVGRDQAELLRVCSLAVRAMQDRGVSDVERRVIVAESALQGTVLVKRGAFTPRELAAARSVCAARRWWLAYPRPDGLFPGFADLIASGGSEAYYQRQRYDLRPTTDDSPFFFDLVRQQGAPTGWPPLSLFIQARDSVGRAVLRVTFQIAAALSALFILLPLAVCRRRGMPESGWPAWLGYFAALGLGFMAIEMLLMQRLVLLLGHPVYAVTVVLSALLVASGVGSLVSGRVRRPAAALVAAVALLLAWFWIHDALWQRLSIAAGCWTLPGRVALSVVLIAPGGFLLGMPLPLGLRAAARREPALAPWAWGVNLCFSVVGSIAAVFVAMVYGLRAELGLAAVAYAAAPVLFLAASRRAGGAAP